MGIHGLLPNIKSVTNRTHIRDYAGLTIGIDASCWLHKGVYSCSVELCKKIPTTKYVDYCMKNIRTLLDHNIKPYVVFDGDALPMKKGTENARHANREKNFARAVELEKNGDHQGARQCFNKAVDVTPEMGRAFMDALEEHRIPFVVAPYEADSQLAYLAQSDLVQVVMTEDSDLVAYGCERVLFKWDRDSLEGDEVHRRELGSCEKLDLVGLDSRSILNMCILSGCDYLDSLPGVGMVKANKFVRKHRNIRTLFRSLRWEGEIKMPSNYEEKFHCAVMTFLYARVWCPKRHCVVHINELPPDVDPNKLSYLGPQMNPEIAEGIALGLLNPFTKVPMIRGGGGGGGGGVAKKKEGNNGTGTAAAVTSRPSLKRQRGGGGGSGSSGGGSGRSSRQPSVKQYLKPRKEVLHMFKPPRQLNGGATNVDRSGSSSGGNDARPPRTLGMHRGPRVALQQQQPRELRQKTAAVQKSSYFGHQKRKTSAASGVAAAVEVEELQNHHHPATLSQQVDRRAAASATTHQPQYKSPNISTEFGPLTQQIRSYTSTSFSASSSSANPSNAGSSSNVASNVFGRYASNKKSSAAKRQRVSTLGRENQINGRDMEEFSPSSSSFSSSSSSSSSSTTTTNFLPTPAANGGGADDIINTYDEPNQVGNVGACTPSHYRSGGRSSSGRGDNGDCAAHSTTSNMMGEQDSPFLAVYHAGKGLDAQNYRQDSAAFVVPESPPAFSPRTYHAGDTSHSSSSPVFSKYHASEPLQGRRSRPNHTGLRFTTMDSETSSPPPTNHPFSNFEYNKHR